MKERSAPMTATDDHPTDWYVLRARARGGPYPYAMVREGVKGGLISRHDLVWRPGWAEWRDAGAVDGLFAATATDRGAAPPQQVGAPDRQPVADNAAPSIPPPGLTASANPDHAAFNYFMAHWRGEFSVPAALFGNGVIVGLVLLIGATIFATVLKEDKISTSQYAAIIVALSVVYLVSIFWLLVGVCRSALRRWSRRRADAR
jgi:hypothetical protein